MMESQLGPAWAAAGMLGPAATDWRRCAAAWRHVAVGTEAGTSSCSLSSCSRLRLYSPGCYEALSGRCCSVGEGGGRIADVLLASGRICDSSEQLPERGGTLRAAGGSVAKAAIFGLSRARLQ